LKAASARDLRSEHLINRSSVETTKMFTAAGSP